MPSQLGDLDPTRQVIVDGSGSPALGGITLADGIELAGFVVQGVQNPPPLPPLPAGAALLRRAIDVSGDFSGYRIHHNLIRLNTVGVQFGSNGRKPSRLDHNCLRRNGWGVATDFRHLLGASIDRNSTYDTQNFAFELLGLRAEDRREDITLAHNVSRQDNTPYLLVGTRRTTVAANRIQSAQFGIRVNPGNTDLVIERNVIDNSLGTNRLGLVLQGIVFPAPAAGQAPTSGAILRGNVVSGLGIASTNPAGDGIAAAGPPIADRHALVDSWILDNVTSGNLRDGIVLRGGNTGNTLRGNVSERNGGHGILLQGSPGNVVAANVASGNGFDGITLQRAVRLGVAFDATGNTLEGNLAAHNGRDGIAADAFATGNTFLANTMLGNGAYDARDLAFHANTWAANVCLVDWPVDAIC